MVWYKSRIRSVVTSKHVVRTKFLEKNIVVEGHTEGSFNYIKKKLRFYSSIIFILIIIIFRKVASFIYLRTHAV